MQITFLITMLLSLAAFPASANDWVLEGTIAPSSTTKDKLLEEWPGDAPVVDYPCVWSLVRCDLDDFVRRQDICALFVMQGGKPVHFRTWGDNPRCNSRVERNRYGLASVTKSLTSLLVGETLRQSPKYSEETPVEEALESADIEYPRQGRELRHLLMMTTGIGWRESETRDFIRIEQLQSSDLPVSLADGLRRRLSRDDFDNDWDPAAPEWSYSSLDSQLLGAFIEAQHPRGFILPDFFQRTVGAEVERRYKIEWKGDATPSASAYCCWYMAPGDLARIGHWVLSRHGEPGSAMGNWVRQSVQETVETDESCRLGGERWPVRYGYHWRVLPAPFNSFLGYGEGGQFLHIFPKTDTVIVQLSAHPGHNRRDRCEAMLVHRQIADGL